MDLANPPTTNQQSYKQTYLPWVVWILGCLFYFYEFLLQVSPSVMAKELMRDFAITSQTLGFISGIYFYSYSPMQLPGGLLMDYFGPKRLLTIACTICALSTIAFSMTTSIYLACLARLAIGFGSAFAAVGAMKLSSNWFPANKFALLTGIMVTIGMLGAIGGEAPLAILIEHYNWRNSMFILGCAGILISLLLHFVASDGPQKPLSSKTKSSSKKEPILKNLTIILRNKQLWLVAIYGGLMYMSTPVLCGLWGVPFLMVKLGITKITAAAYISFVLIGWAIASPLWGYISNRIGSRKLPMYIGCVGSLISLITLIYVPYHATLFIQFLLLSFGIMSAGFLPAFATAKEVTSKNSVAAGLGFMNMMNMVGIAICQPAIGFMLDRMWDGGKIEGVRVYSLTAYHTALSILPIGIFIALLTLPLIVETNCTSIHDKPEM